MPQFDPQSGKYCGYETYDGPVAQILFRAVTPRLAEQIASQKDVARASQLAALDFEVPPGVKAELYRKGTLMLFPRHICGFCEAEFSADVSVCPRCLAKNQWYCGTCDCLIEDPVIDRIKRQIRCPTCERTDPRGVRQIQCIGEFSDEKIFTHYILSIGNERHIILDYKRLR